MQQLTTPSPPPPPPSPSAAQLLSSCPAWAGVPGILSPPCLAACLLLDLLQTLHSWLAWADLEDLDGTAQLLLHLLAASHGQQQQQHGLDPEGQQQQHGLDPHPDLDLARGRARGGQVVAGSCLAQVAARVAELTSIPEFQMLPSLRAALPRAITTLLSRHCRAIVQLMLAAGSQKGGHRQQQQGAGVGGARADREEGGSVKKKDRRKRSMPPGQEQGQGQQQLSTSLEQGQEDGHHLYSLLERVGEGAGLSPGSTKRLRRVLHGQALWLSSQADQLLHKGVAETGSKHLDPILDPKQPGGSAALQPVLAEACAVRALLSCLKRECLQGLLPPQLSGLAAATLVAMAVMLQPLQPHGGDHSGGPYAPLLATLCVEMLGACADVAGVLGQGSGSGSGSGSCVELPAGLPRSSLVRWLVQVGGRAPGSSWVGGIQGPGSRVCGGAGPGCGGVGGGGVRGPSG